MNPRSQASAGVTSFAVAAVIVVLLAAAAGIVILESAPAAPKSSSTSGVSTTSVLSSVLSASSETSPASCANRSTTTSSSGQAQGYGLANPVGVGVFFNGSIFQGPMMGFTVASGSSSAINVTVTYPWSGLSLPGDACIPVSFAIGPFPADSKQGTIPGWLHVSLSSSSGATTPDSNASVDLQVRADSSAPQGATGSFELLVTYLDPASGDNVTDGNVLNLVASSSTKPAGALTQTCCSSNVTSVTLAAPTSPGGAANLTLTVLNAGYYPVGPLEAFVENGTVPPGNNPPPNSGITFYNGTIPANVTRTFSVSVPASIVTVVPGGQYTVVVQVDYAGASGGLFQFSTHRTVVTATR